MHWLLKRHIKKRYEEEKSRPNSELLIFPDNWEEVLDRYKHIAHREGVYVIFSDYSFTPNSLNASSMLPGGVLFSKEWAVRAVLFDGDETRNAFMVAVGHELSHKEKEYPRLRYSGCDREFIAKTNEVLADYNGAKRMLHSSRRDLLRSIFYKRQHRISMGKEDTGDRAHPSWERRAYYVTKYNFDAKLIEQM